MTLAEEWTMTWEEMAVWMLVVAETWAPTSICTVHAYKALLVPEVKSGHWRQLPDKGEKHYIKKLRLLL